MDNKKKEKSEGEKLAEKLLSDKKNGGLRLSEEKIKTELYTEETFDKLFEKIVLQ